MPIEFVKGDLFANRFKAQALAHGCNCQGSMGAGIAKGFRERYPAMYEAYRRRCKSDSRKFNLGDAWLWKDEDRPWVFNLATQEGYWHARASYGGLSWKKVRAIVEEVFGSWKGTLYVYEAYAPEGTVTRRN